MRGNKVILCLIMAVMLCFTAAALAEDESAWDYNISMSVRSATGDYLPAPPVPPEMLQDGLIISVYNDCLDDNEMTLVLLCNGRVIPFLAGSRDAEPVRQAYVTVPSRQEAELTVYPMLDGAAVQAQEPPYLHVVLIGLCDVYPRSTFDDVQGFSTVVSIPVMADKAVDEPVANRQPVEEATKPAGRVSTENIFYGMKILSVNDVERNTMLFRTDGDLQSIRFAIIPDDADVYVCCFVDNVLQPINGYDGIRIHASKGMSYEGEIHLSLEPGKHQIYLMCVPMFDQSPCFVTSEKIVVEVAP